MTRACQAIVALALALLAPGYAAASACAPDPAASIPSALLTEGFQQAHPDL